MSISGAMRKFNAWNYWILEALLNTDVQKALYSACRTAHEGVLSWGQNPRVAWTIPTSLVLRGYHYEQLGQKNTNAFQCTVASVLGHDQRSRFGFLRIRPGAAH